MFSGVVSIGIDKIIHLLYITGNYEHHIHFSSKEEATLTMRSR